MRTTHVARTGKKEATILAPKKSAAPQSAVAEALKTVLADTYLLAVKTQNFHWNVEGAQFVSLHQLFETQYTDLNGSIDAIAERIRALGQRAPGSLSAFSELSSIKEASSGSIKASDMVNQLIKDNQVAGENCRKAAAIAGEAGDSATAGMLDERTTAHEKATWMLRAVLA